MGVEYIKASFEIISKYIVDLVEIDEFHFQSEGWKKENFLSKAHLKFELSRLIIFDDILIGYAIISSKTTSIHIHRFVIKDEYKSKKFGYSLMKIIFNEGKKITLKVSVDNLIAISFYKKMKFEILRSENQYYLMKNENK